MALLTSCLANAKKLMEKNFFGADKIVVPMMANRSFRRFLP